jgi:hypothetical protein
MSGLSEDLWSVCSFSQAPFFIRWDQMLLDCSSVQTLRFFIPRYMQERSEYHRHSTHLNQGLHETWSSKKRLENEYSLYIVAMSVIYVQGVGSLIYYRLV